MSEIKNLEFVIHGVQYEDVNDPVFGRATISVELFVPKTAVAYDKETQQAQLKRSQRTALNQAIDQVKFDFQSTLPDRLAAGERPLVLFDEFMQALEPVIKQHSQDQAYILAGISARPDIDVYQDSDVYNEYTDIFLDRLQAAFRPGNRLSHLKKHP